MRSRKCDADANGDVNEDNGTSNVAAAVEIGGGTRTLDALTLSAEVAATVDAAAGASIAKSVVSDQRTAWR